MNKNTVNIFITLIIIPSMALGALKMRNLRIKPEFIKPGQEVTIYVEAVHDFNTLTNLAGVFSTNNSSWDNADDYLFLYNGGEGLTALDPPIPQVYTHQYTTPNGTFVGWYEYNWKTIVPATFTDGQILTLIVRGTQSRQMIPDMNPQDELSITIEVASNKGVCYNTANIFSKFAIGQLVIISPKPILAIIADPGDGTHFQGDTTITLTVLFENDTVTDATVVYTLDGSDPSSGGTPYTGPFIIDRSLTVKALATKDGYIPAEGSWTYIKDLISTGIWAVPDSGTTFGVELSVSLHTNADSIHYTTDNSNPITNGIPYNGPFIVSDDISIVRGIAFGQDYDTVSGLWIYYRDTVPKVIADPGSMQFTNSVSVTLSLSEPWPGAVIYYTLDGSDPDTNSSTTYKYDGTPIVITETTTLKAQAFAGNAMPSEITTEIYTLVFGVVRAEFQDATGDGSIDRAEIVINKEADNLPLEIEFTNPYKSSDIKTVSSSSIAWLNNDASTKTIIAILPSPFPYTGSTSFTTDTYGRITSGDYTKDPFPVSDGVAPVIDKATYWPGKIVDKKTLTRANDTLIVYFSEEVSSLGSGVIQPFKLITENGIEYFFDLQVHKSNANRFTLLVEYDGINGVDFPMKGDSIWIDSDFGISDLQTNIQEIDNNRHVELIVNPKPVFIIINSLVPFVPVKGSFNLPNLTNISSGSLNQLAKQDGLLMIVDFLTDLISVGHTIKASVNIFDPLGNRLGYGPHKSSNSKNIYMGNYDNGGLTQLIIYWPGQNLNGRTVGPGTYLAEIQITLTDDVSTYFQGTFYEKVGVKDE